MPQYCRQLRLMMPTTRPVQMRRCSGAEALLSSASYVATTQFFFINLYKRKKIIEMLRLDYAEPLSHITTK